MNETLDIDTTQQLHGLLDPGPTQASQVVSPEDASLRDKRAYYELLVRAGFFLPKLSSKFVNQKMLMLVREGSVFVPKQAQVVFRVCCTPPQKQVMIDKYVRYCGQNSLEHGISAKAQNFPDKEYLVLAIATLSGGGDEIFERNYYPLAKQPRLNTPLPLSLNNTDGLLTNIPPHLLGSKGRSIKLSVLTPEQKMQVKMMRAEEAIRKHQAHKTKLEKEIQTQKIAKALTEESQAFDAAAERERMRAEIAAEIEAKANQFVATREREMQAEFERQMQIAQQQLGPSQDDSMAGKQTKRRPQSKMAPFPNTVRNADSLGDNTFE